MSELLQFFKDMRDNGYGLAEIAAQLGTSAIAEPVAGFAAMYDPVHGADAIREGMTYQPRTQEAQQYSQSVGNAAKTAVKPAMPIIDTWKKGVDIAGQYNPVVGATLRTVPTAIGIAMGAKPALQAGRQVSEGLGAMQGRMIANANAPRTLNMGFRGQRGAIGLTNDFDNSDEIKIIADYLGQSPESMLVNRDLYTKKQGAINSLVSRYEQMDDFSGAYYPTSYGYISISPSAKSNGQWQLTSFDKKMNPLSDQGEMSKNKALTEFFKTIKPNKYGNITPVQTTPKRPLTEFEQAHLTAQQRAALPVNQGGLGLAPDNTAMDRARAMGGIEGVHYSRTGADVQELDSGKYAISPFDAIGTHIGSKEAAAQRFNTTRIAIEDPKGVSYPVVMLGNKELRNKDSQPMSEDALVNDLISRGAWDGTDYHKKNAELRKQYFSEYDRIPYINDVEDAGKVSYIVPPENIRSRFAAFDPFNRDSSNLLAQSAKLAPTTALGAYMYNEKRKKSQGKQ